MYLNQHLNGAYFFGGPPIHPSTLPRIFMNSLTIHELPDQERPREKLLRRGVESLTDAEILAILLRTGIPGCNAIELARLLLQSYGALGSLARCPVAELSNFK